MELGLAACALPTCKWFAPREEHPRETRRRLHRLNQPTSSLQALVKSGTRDQSPQVSWLRSSCRASCAWKGQDGEGRTEAVLREARGMLCRAVDRSTTTRSSVAEVLITQGRLALLPSESRSAPLGGDATTKIRASASELKFHRYMRLFVASSKHVFHPGRGLTGRRPWGKNGTARVSVRCRRLLRFLFSSLLTVAKGHIRCQRTALNMRPGASLKEGAPRSAEFTCAVDDVPCILASCLCRLCGHEPPS